MKQTTPTPDVYFFPFQRLACINQTTAVEREYNTAVVKLDNGMTFNYGAIKSALHSWLTKAMVCTVV